MAIGLFLPKSCGIILGETMVRERRGTVSMLGHERVICAAELVAGIVKVGVFLGDLAIRFFNDFSQSLEGAETSARKDMDKKTPTFKAAKPLRMVALASFPGGHMSNQGADRMACIPRGSLFAS